MYPPPAPPHIAPEVRAIIDDRSWLEADGAYGTTTKYIVGVDYGTTYSGFGLYQVGAEASDGSIIIKTYDTWEKQPPGLFSPKVPTVSTYSRAGLSLEQWGWPAAVDYSGRPFKVALAKLALHPDTPPHRRPLIPEGITVRDVIADYLNKLLVVVRSLAPDLSPENTIWCFTIPVNWKADAADEMRQAAFQAGMIASPDSRRLRFCEEPEAAALTCIEEANIPMHPGQTFLVVDAGGGTVDLFHCTVGADRRLDEITVGEGDFLGASFVDARFYDFLRAHIGEDAFDSLTLSPALSNTWRDMEARWENMKRSFVGPPPGYTPPVSIDAPPDPDGERETITFSRSLYNTIEEEAKAALRERQAGIDDELWITPADMQRFFDPVVQKVRDMVLRQLRGGPGSDSGSGRMVDWIFFVGGFGSNKYLQHRVACDPDVRGCLRGAGTLQRGGVPGALQIRQPESAVLKGAVRYGKERGRIRTRKAKHTLALLVHVNAAYASSLQASAVAPNSASSGSHPVDRNIARIGDATYLVLVRKGDTVSYDSLVQHAHLALGDRSTTGVVKIFEIDAASPRLIGRITITAPITPGQKRRVTLLVNFGELELRIRAVNELTGQEWSAAIQYDVTQDHDRQQQHGASHLRTASSGDSQSNVSGVQVTAPSQADRTASLARSLDRMSIGSNDSAPHREGSSSAAGASPILGARPGDRSSGPYGAIPPRRSSDAQMGAHYLPPSHLPVDQPPPPGSFVYPPRGQVAHVYGGSGPAGYLPPHGMPPHGAGMGIGMPGYYMGHHGIPQYHPMHAYAPMPGSGAPYRPGSTSPPPHPDPAQPR